MTAEPASRKPMIPIDVSQLGPAMQALPNDMWRAAAVARFMVRPGQGANTKAAKMAGFGEGKKQQNVRITAHQVFHDPRMLEALHELGEQYLKQGVPDAIAVVQQIMHDRRAKGGDRLRAAQIYIDRAHPVTTTHHVKVERSPDVMVVVTEKVLEKIRKLALAAGLDPQKQIEAVANPVERS
jgi:hypothetical protein